jgi:photosystem II stability/assembly factor-like uncharacterized protein
LRCVYNDGDHVCVAGFGGTILVSSDGGEHWHSSATGTKNTLTSICGSGSHLWTVGTTGTILYSADGGEHWKAQMSGSPLHLKDVRGGLQPGVVEYRAKILSSNLWAVGYGGIILHSTDGGENWLRNPVNLKKPALH